MDFPLKNYRLKMQKAKNELIKNFVAVYQARLAGMDALITSGEFTK